MPKRATPAAQPADSLVPGLRALLARHGLAPRKALGQHFLIDADVLRRIAAAADLAPEDAVVEVGPGPGLLTRELLARAGRVVAVEKDEGMARLLRAEFPDPRLTVVEGDMLEVPLESIVPGRPYKVVANLPYYVASPIVRRFLEAEAKPALLVVLLQREVAEGIAAGPGDMSVLAAGVQYYAVPRVVAVVEPGSFYPPPKVDSAILRLDVRPSPAVNTPPGMFFRVVRAGFSARRKQLVNSLSQELGLDKARLAGLLESAGIMPQRRAETLALADWEKLCRALEGESWS